MAESAEYWEVPYIYGLRLGISVQTIERNNDSVLLAVSYSVMNGSSLNAGSDRASGYVRQAGSSSDILNFAGPLYVDAFATVKLGETAFYVSKTETTQTLTFTAHISFMAEANVSVSITVPAYVRAPYALENIRFTSDDDIVKRVAWDVRTDEAHPISNIRIERMKLGGTWQLIATLDPSSTHYGDTPRDKNTSYQYRVYGINSQGIGEYAYSPISYSSPAAPQLTSWTRLSAETIRVDCLNAAYMATALEVQRKPIDGGSYETVGVFPGLLTSFEDSPGVGIYRYRARNVLNVGKVRYSAWAELDRDVASAAAPATPTLSAPSSSEVIDIDQPLVFRWAHIPIDGTSETAAELEWSTDDGATWTHENTADGSSNLTVDPDVFGLNSTVLWRVRTKGAYAEWSPWSQTGMFFARRKPAVTINSPESPIERVPVSIAFDYADESGELANTAVRIYEGRDTYSRVICDYNAGVDTSFDIPVEAFFPVNKTTYTVVLSVRSTSGFTVEITRTVAVDFIEPMLGDLAVAKDEKTGYSSLMVAVIPDEEREPVVEFSIWRVSEAGRKLLAEHLTDRASITDMYAPLNADYYYEVVSFAASGIYAVNRFDEHFFSKRAFFYWSGDYAYLDYNPEVEITLGRPAKTRVYFAGRAYPVSYDSVQASRDESMSGRVFERDNALKLRQLMTDGGRCIYKSLDGEVYNADAEINLKPILTTPAVWGEASVSLVRIDGGLL